MFLLSSSSHAAVYTLITCPDMLFITAKSGAASFIQIGVSCRWYTCWTVWTQPPSFVHLTIFWKRLALWYLRTSKNLLRSKSFIIPTRNMGLSLGQGTLPKPCELLASWSLYSVSMTTHRADCEQTKGSVSQTAVKNPNEKHILNVLYRCPRNAPKIWIMPAYLTS